MTDNPLLESSERTISAQINICYDLALPAGLKPARPRPLLIALHGYGGNKRQMMRLAQGAAPDEFAVASLQGFHQHLKEPKEKGGPLRYGFGWLTNFRPEESVALHHAALLKLIDSVVADGIADSARIFLLGFSQSCAINYRFAFSYPNVLRGVIGICGGIPGDWDTNEAYRHGALSVFHLCGASDEFYPPSRVHDYKERLGARAENVDLRSYEAGHEINGAMQKDTLNWLRSRAAAG